MSNGLFSLVQKLGSTQLQNIVENLAQESAVDEGRTVIDYKLFDRIVINDGFVSMDEQGIITSKQGRVTLPQLTQFFNKTAEGRTLQGLMLGNNTSRINNLVLDGKADEPYRFDRLAVDIEVFDCDGNQDDQGQAAPGLAAVGGQSDRAMQIAKQIAYSGKLVLNVNGRDLNYAEPLGFAGSSIAIDGTRIVNAYNKKTPKFIDPAIFLPETTSFNAKIEMVEPVEIDAAVSVAITVSLIGYKFLKNA